MAFVDTQWRIQVRGALFGGEQWNNTWTVEDQTTGQDVQEAVDILHDLYDEFSSLGLSGAWTATGATAKNLATDELLDADWALITGQTGDPLLPTECALRISLRDNAGHRGGPFLAGFAASVVEDAGQLNTSQQQGIADEIGLKAADLIAAGWRIGIESPTDTAVYLATVARVGRTFDAIRKRRNEIPEAYVSTSVAP